MNFDRTCISTNHGKILGTFSGEFPSGLENPPGNSRKFMNAFLIQGQFI